MDPASMAPLILAQIASQGLFNKGGNQQAVQQGLGGQLSPQLLQMIARGSNPAPLPGAGGTPAGGANGGMMGGPVPAPPPVPSGTLPIPPQMVNTLPTRPLAPPAPSPMASLIGGPVPSPLIGGPLPGGAPATPPVNFGLGSLPMGPQSPPWYGMF